MRGLYVRVVRLVRAALRAIGVLGLLDAWARRSRTGVWVRSLLSIYDVDELVALDVPWWTFDSMDLVAEHLRDRPDATVLEWGSGASTAWLARRAGRVTAVEHDPAWAAQVRRLVGGNASVVTVPPVPVPASVGAEATTGSRKAGFEGLDFTDYVSAIDAVPGSFDLIVIDGRAREACLRRALPRLADDGVIVFDNVDRQRYRDAIADETGLDVVWTRGLTPALPFPNRTALLRRSRTS